MIKEERRFKIKPGTQPYSRYRGLARIVYEDGVEEVESMNNVVIPRSTSDQFYKVEPECENRLDKVSFIYYNTPRLWWVIAYASNILDPFNVPVGTRLRIPPLGTALSSEVI